MPSGHGKSDFKIRKVQVSDIKAVYKMLVANRPYVGLNSRYTYLLLARDFSDSCVVAENDGKVVAFSSGYVPPARQDTLFNWETVVQRGYRGNGLQKRLLLHQIDMTDAKFFEGTVNPSNAASERNFFALAKLLGTKCEKSMLFDEEVFEHDGHESEVLFRIGPISKAALKKAIIQLV